MTKNDMKELVHFVREVHPDIYDEGVAYLEKRCCKVHKLDEATKEVVDEFIQYLEPVAYLNGTPKYTTSIQLDLLYRVYMMYFRIRTNEDGFIGKRMSKATLKKLLHLEGYSVGPVVYKISGGWKSHTSVLECKLINDELFSAAIEYDSLRYQQIEGDEQG